MKRLEGKVAIVTGASRGIGKAIALAYGAEGAKVVATARTTKAIVGLVAKLEEEGTEALAVSADLCREADIGRIPTETLARFGRIDILVNNAAITRDQLALRMKRADWDAVLETNLTGAYLCIQQALGGMLRQRSGRIINVASVVAQTGNPGQANYIAAKAGLIGLTRALAVELASRNITVNAVAPGFIISPMTDPLPEKLRQALIDRIPLRRMGAEGEVAAGICFLASDEAAYITGHVLNINGGLYLA